jgi:HlyD family secretion protein
MQSYLRTIFVFLALVMPLAAATAQMPPALVVAAPVVEREVAAGQTFVGTVMPLTTATVGSAVDGRVIEFPLNEGDRVERGQALAQLLTETIQLEVEAAEAELELRQQELAELENGTRPEEIAQAKARMDGAEAQARYLAARRARAESLYQNNRTVTEEERDEAVSAAIAAEQSYLEAKQAYQLAVEGPRKERIAQARAQVAMAQAAVSRLQDQFEKHTIISRFAGYITAEHTEVGQWVKQGDPVVEVAALDEVEIVAQVVEQYVPFMREGMMVRIEVPALPDKSFSGVISAIVPQADVQARTFPVKIRVKNELSEHGPLLKSGMYARAMLPTGTKRMATLVPKDALVLGGQQPLVYAVDALSPNGQDAKARAVPVRLGVAEGDSIQVIGAVEPGQLVVVQGNERLMPGRDLKIQRVLAAGAALPLSQAGLPAK